VGAVVRLRTVGRVVIRRVILLAVIVLALGTTLPATLAQPVEAADRALEIEMRAFRFVPDFLRVTVGDTVTLSVTNKDSVGHNLFIPELGIRIGNATAPIGPGNRSSATFRADRIGEFWFYCEVPGHATRLNGGYSGMAGRLVVEQEAVQPPDSTMIFILLSFAVSAAAFATVVGVGLYLRRRWRL